MSIVRIGLGETKNFAEGYDAIFGKKDEKAAKPEEKPSGEQAQQPEKKEKKKK
jgi:hypothetical protein